MRIYFKILFLIIAFNSFAQKELSIIGNSVGFSSVSLQEARSIFKGKYNYWQNKSKVILVLPSTKNANSLNSSKIIYGTTPDGVKKYWLSLVFQGRASSPIFFDTDKEIIEYISNNEGAIGIISTEQSKNVSDKIKIILGD